MRTCVKADEIPRDIKAQLPVISKAVADERSCMYCYYYAGALKKKPRCMLKNCAWENEKEFFHPVLRQLAAKRRRVVQITKTELDVATVRYLDALKAEKVTDAMFKEEKTLEERKKDQCYQCVYNKGEACIGICWKTL